ncbi:HTH-type transcriptional regulator DegA [Streptococcus canis]|uniref:HTH-type transcriptional regulator DegA n=1 Tax=Streptococcus canis TaxID=1329 RepID=A0A3P5XRP6_STRCB|nr:LacI family DNA-binding transcriptional regulator [Streptococcus canis]QKG77807.1 LacI family DNA-binding transcriptional regulator [Streptococcus canis]VDC43175.1 HTH-type transcriptional regulator DegA [Streptococcus canis]
MTSKITIKDIAREVGISVTTVSYVLNQRNDQKISEETCNKVLHISNLLNYTPNQAA